MDRIELGRELRARRQAAGRTIASVAMDASLSVPYIANLENGRGNPTLAALQQLAAALGTRLDVSLRDLAEETADESPAAPEGVRRLAVSPRAVAVARRLARAQRTRVAVVTERIEQAALAVAALKGGDPGDFGERDMDRLLDLLLLLSLDEE